MTIVKIIMLNTYLKIRILVLEARLIIKCIKSSYDLEVYDKLVVIKHNWIRSEDRSYIE